MWKGTEVRAHMTDLARELGQLTHARRRARRGCGCTTSIPIPHVDAVIPLMAEGLLTPYLDIPFQHASPKVLRAMKRPANEAQGARADQDRGARSRPTSRSARASWSAFPGETEDDFQYLLDWLEEAQLDRVGAFRFEPVAGAQANALPDPVPEAVKEERYARIMEVTERDQRRQARRQGRAHAAGDRRRGRRARRGRRHRRDRAQPGRRARDRRPGVPAQCARPPQAGRLRARR